MKKLFAVILAIFVMSFCANVSLACDCPCCEKAKTTAECCQKLNKECECGCSKITCKKVKKCVKKCMKKCAKKGCCCNKPAIDCPVKCKKELNPENKKSVSEIITDSIVPANNETEISSEKCDKVQCCSKCPCMQKCLKKCKKDLSKCPKKGCPLKDIIEE